MQRQDLYVAEPGSDGGDRNSLERVRFSFMFHYPSPLQPRRFSGGRVGLDFVGIGWNFLELAGNDES